MSKIKILISGRDCIFRDGLYNNLTKHGSYELICCTDKVDETLTSVILFQPDICILELYYPELGGIEVFNLLKEDGVRTKIIFYTKDTDEFDIYNVIKAGAWGLVNNGITAIDLYKAINMVYAGKRYFAEVTQSDIERILFQTEGKVTRLKKASLTIREMDILKSYVNGETLQEIKTRYHIDKSTIDSHRQNVLKKLNFKSTSELISKGRLLLEKTY